MRPAMGSFGVRNDRLHGVQPVAANGTATIPTRLSG